MIRSKRIRIKKELLEMKQFKADERVMMMDLNCLSEEQQEFYRLRRLETLEKKKKGSVICGTWNQKLVLNSANVNLALTF
ncbi:hypothetical protein RHMOL_Rhmol09G0213000 [Rhododendron molle]|uniref:Uncharacterized protein n=1 Tax=Rhododendron molle TaxID=49168 RepID=A0ACC0MFK3_RHOML|nr:hypothetical protein RHMOL_Rhmol09G0213000 [Rhododendron molle]